MERFVLHCEKFGYFKAGNSGSLWYNETDFVEKVEEAKWYKQKKLALKKASDLMKQSGGIEEKFIDVQVIPIDVTINVKRTGPTYSGKELVSDEFEKSKKLYDIVQAMTYDEREALSNKKWKEFLTAKNFVRAFKDRFDGE